MKFATGWFGIPGGPESRSTKVHAIHWRTGKPVCGSTLSDRQEFQFCSAGVNGGYLECERCKEWNRKQEIARFTKSYKHLLKESAS